MKPASSAFARALADDIRRRQQSAGLVVVTYENNTNQGMSADAINFARIIEQEQTGNKEEHKMAYDPTGFEIGSDNLAKPNTRAEGVVIEIQEGALKDFYSAETLTKFEDRNPEAPCINVIVEMKYNDHVFRRGKTISLPTGKLCHPKSTMAGWLKQYGSAPKVGQKVTMLANQKGYFDILV